MKWGSFVAGGLAGLTAAAVARELAKAPAERTWKGTVAGLPYNFDLASWEEIAREYWNPESDALITPHVLGLGWGLNLAALSRRAQVARRTKAMYGQAQELVARIRPAKETDEDEAAQIPEPAQG